ncbi:MULTISPECIES: LacI family DNA-binding transcriptional regulator [Microbacterium]|uniref:LacI family DNA-binding transcriptional regulator n=1 Tax=Microbacterium TaxID=33882 RepID=UPI0013A59911|nr:LacI family DNA-binding transcriptional regulator [Microbacterium sp. KCTC 39802]
MSAPGASGAGASGRAATIYDVAQHAGVSHQTVSRFLRGFPGIRPETRARVEAALAELDYQPNLTARSLKSGRAHRIGALVHDESETGPSLTAHGATMEAREAGYLLDLIPLDAHDGDSIQRSLALIGPYSLAGILALASTDEMLHAFDAASFTMPAYIHSEADDTRLAKTDVSRVGMPALMAHLRDLGHRRVAHIAGPSNWSAGRNRARAFASAVEDLGLIHIGQYTGDWSARSGFDAIAGLPELPDATAYVVANDQMAIGAILALKRRGLRVPEDVSVVGIDDLPESAYIDPPLTTLRVDHVARGREAVASLIGQIEGVPPRSVPIEVPHLVVRESSGPAPREDVR